MRQPANNSLLLIVLGALALTFGCGEDSSPQAARSFSVGVTTRQFVDTTRSTPENHGVAARPMRELPTEIWYPAVPIVGTAETNVDAEQRDAPLDNSGAPYPLLIFVHGSGSFRRQSTFLMQALAASGYIVAAADFPLTALATPGGASDLHFDDQVGDLSFLATQLNESSQDRADPFFGAVNRSGYGIIGHSTGGTVALLAAYAPDVHDPRTRAAIALAPCACFLDPPFFHTRSLPLMIIAGSDDLLVPYSDNGRRAFDLAMPPKFFALLVGGTHVFFTDFDLSDSIFGLGPTTSEDDIAIAVRRYGTGIACDSPPPPGSDPPMSIEDQHANTVSLVVGFVDHVFRRDDALLNEVENAGNTAVLIEHE